MMTFTHLHKDLHGNTVTEIEYRAHDDEGIHEVIQGFKQFLLAVGFQLETVDKYIETE